jgi:hypothetical protein
MTQPLDGYCGGDGLRLDYLEWPAARAQNEMLMTGASSACTAGSPPLALA